MVHSNWKCPIEIKLKGPFDTLRKKLSQSLLNWCICFEFGMSWYFHINFTHWQVNHNVIIYVKWTSLPLLRTKNVKVILNDLCRLETLNKISHLRLDRENIRHIDGLELLGDSVRNLYLQKVRYHMSCGTQAIYYFIKKNRLIICLIWINSRPICKRFE